MSVPTRRIVDEDGNDLMATGLTVDTGDLEDKADEAKALIGEVQASPTSNTVLDRLKTLATRIGEVQASPTSNTILDRLKALLTGIVLAAGTNVIGKVRLVTATGDEVTDDTYDVVKTLRQGQVTSSGVKSGDAAIKASAGTVYWISICDDTNDLTVDLNDSDDNSGTDQWSQDYIAPAYAHYIFDPPLPFASGIYLDVSTATCKVVVGYI